MSNTIYLDYTKFVDLDGEGKELGYSYGFRIYYGSRIYDDFNKTYDKGFESFEELTQTVNKDTVLEYLRKNYPDFYDAICIAGNLDFNDEVIVEVK